jgi:hypothetical protein
MAKWRTTTPRIYVGCLPCKRGWHVADIEHANGWIEKHWETCKRSHNETLGATA